jgi:SAM-dependent methyltransferase
VYAGVSLTTLATLVLELALTRIFSVVFHYHFAFLAISIALFGLGAGGLFSYAFRGRPVRLFPRLGALAALNSVAVVLTLALVLSRQGGLSGGTLAAVYLASAVPFFLAGTIVSTVIAETVERVERVYFFDLVGAALGCVLLVPLLNFVGGPNTVLGAAILFAAASAIWFTLAGSLGGRVVSVGLALAIAALVLLNAKQSVVDVKYAKGEPLPGECYVRWNSYSRVAVSAGREAGQVGLYIDAGAWSRIGTLDPERASGEERRALLGEAGALPFALRPGARTLVIGAGGGWEILRALVAGSRHVTGVEPNPIVADTIMRGRYAALSHRLYFRPDVRIVVGDGRSFVRWTEEQFQVIEVPLPANWSAVQAGALAFSENSLLTVEALTGYLERLEPRGLLVFSAWSSDPPRESLRLAALAARALRNFGPREAWRHLLVVRQSAGAPPRDTILVGREPLTEDDLERAAAFAGENRIETVYLPGRPGGGFYAELLRAPDPGRFLAGYPYDVSPVSDNRPFFFHTARSSLPWRQPLADGPGASPSRDDAVDLLYRLLGACLLATAAVLAVPPAFLGRRQPCGRRANGFLWYFIFIGAGYVVVQVALIQKFVLFLGHPTQALTVIMFSMLVSSGLGSLLSRRLAGSSQRNLRGALAAVALLVAALAVLVPPLASGAAGWPLWLKIPMTVILIAPAAFVMGMAFPAGLGRLAERRPGAIRWAWSLNAAASVLGSAAAVFLAIHLGLRETLLIGGVLYLCALVPLSDASRKGGA